MSNYVLINRGNFHLKLLRRFRDIAVFRSEVLYFAAPCRLFVEMVTTLSCWSAAMSMLPRSNLLNLTEILWN